jgi:hypothetical protein
MDENWTFEQHKKVEKKHIKLDQNPIQSPKNNIVKWTKTERNSPPQLKLCKVPLARRKWLDLDCEYWRAADPWHPRDRKEWQPSVRECGRSTPKINDNMRVCSKWFYAVNLPQDSESGRALRDPQLQKECELSNHHSWTGFQSGNGI